MLRSREQPARTLAITIHVPCEKSNDFILMDVRFRALELIHDIDVYTHGEHQPEVFEVAMAGAAKALLKLRDQGVVKAVGLGVNEWQVAHEAIRRQDFDCVLLAAVTRCLEQDALDEFLPS
jgi:D-threo-aldose 1-dehydrogenase